MTAVTQADPRSGHPAGVLTLCRCALLALSGPTKGEEIVIESECFRIGKSPDNDLVLVDPTVSRDHCEIVRDEKGFLLRDLGSTNGTLLDGAEIREGYLRPGVVISVGRVEIKVRPYSERIDVVPSERSSFGELVGTTLAMRELFAVLERLAPSDASLLVGGETGTGKDLLARAVHAASRRARGPFVVVDCGAVVGTLIESELFGHEKGAFTGATQSRKGAFELAHKGTLFLDEVAELPLSLQPKLLRALETRRIRRVGGQTETAVDLRVIAATHRDLSLEVQRGKFREDLYFRLAVVPLHLPALRERRDDIPALARHLLAKLGEQSTTAATAPELDDATLAALMAHDWPGNVRELRNVLERAALLGHAPGVTGVRALSAWLSPARARPAQGDASEAPGSLGFDPAMSYGETRERWENDFERRYVSWLLGRHDGNLAQAAREAGMDRKYLHKLAKKHALRGE